MALKEAFGALKPHLVGRGFQGFGPRNPRL